MKLVKMSLVAAMLMGASAFAVDNVKVSGDARLYYGTNDMYNHAKGDDGSLFDKDNSYADSAVRVGATADLVEGVSAGATFTAVSTLGMENNLVSGVWTGAHGVTANGSTFGAQVDDASWFNEAWIAATMGKTTAKLGRMELDTPLAFSEQWTIAANSFDAIVLLNQDLPDTTLVAAWVGKGNGTPGYVVGEHGNMNTFAIDGAYAYAIVNNSWKPLTVQAWYYDVVRAAQAYWLQADMNLEGIIVGAQYSAMALSGYLDDADDSSAFAVKLGYEMDAFSITGAYSATDTKGTIDISNVATGHTAGSRSKLYTEAWWNRGYVGAYDNSAFNITAAYSSDMVGLAAYYTMVDFGDDSKKGTGMNRDMSELTLEATKSFGPLDTSLVYIFADAKDQNIKPNDSEGTAYNTIQAYITLNF